MTVIGFDVGYVELADRRRRDRSITMNAHRPTRAASWTGMQVNQMRLQRLGSAATLRWHIRPAPQQREPAKLLRQLQLGWLRQATSVSCRCVQVGDQGTSPINESPGALDRARIISRRVAQREGRGR